MSGADSRPRKPTGSFIGFSPSAAIPLLASVLHLTFVRRWVDLRMSAFWHSFPPKDWSNNDWKARVIGLDECGLPSDRILSATSSLMLSCDKAG
jgi:hypothetical protein